MYESPIDCFVTQFNTKLREFEEEQILEAVQGVGVYVDKHELEKALRYDRKQYKKGYADGAKEFAERLQDRCNKQGGCLYASDIGAELNEMVGDNNGI